MIRPIHESCISKHVSEQELYAYESNKANEANNVRAPSSKKYLELNSVQLLDIEADSKKRELYLVTSRESIFHLGPDSGLDWARLLTPAEMADFPYEIIWSGPVVEYEASSKIVTELGKQKSIEVVSTTMFFDSIATIFCESANILTNIFHELQIGIYKTKNKI